VFKHFEIHVETEARAQFIDVTDAVTQYVADSGVVSGIVTVYSQHTSCCVLIQEESEDVTYYGTQYILQDTLNILGSLVPPVRHEGQYLHPGPIHIHNAKVLRDEKPEWGLNTDGHILSSVLGRSELAPIVDARPVLGEFGRIYFGDLDSVRTRSRTIRVVVNGE
jgi:secondary thiamine-phosphate synthase enzyme